MAPLGQTSPIPSPPPEGQKLYEELFFGSAQKDYGFKRRYPEKDGTPAQYEEALDNWHRLLKEITRAAA